MLVKKMIPEPKPATWKQVGEITYIIVIYALSIYGLITLISKVI